MEQSISALTAWNMDCRLRWIMFLQAPGSIRDVEPVFCFWLCWSAFSAFYFFVLVPFLLRDCLEGLLMVPVVAGISFEIIQWAGRSDSKLADFISKPGLAMQNWHNQGTDSRYGRGCDQGCRGGF